MPVLGTNAQSLSDDLGPAVIDLSYTITRLMAEGSSEADIQQAISGEGNLSQGNGSFYSYVNGRLTLQGSVSTTQGPTPTLSYAAQVVNDAGFELIQHGFNEKHSLSMNMFYNRETQQKILVVDGTNPITSNGLINSNLLTSPTGSVIFDPNYNHFTSTSGIAFTGNGPIIFPLVMDIDGDGVETIGLDDSNVYFDMKDTGRLVRTGWADGDDGMLVVDSNSNGIIDDISEHFGGDELGFDKLAPYDTNSDGVINSSDTNFSDLKVWRDINEDGTTDGGELQSLSAHNITEISLNTEDLFQVLDNGNILTQRSSFTQNGVSKDISDIGFQIQPLDSFSAGDYSIDLDTIHLPWLRGTGQILDLLQAASGNEPLKQVIRDTAYQTDAKALYDEMDNLLIHWANVDDVNPNTNRGAYSEQRAQLLEKFLDVVLPQEIHQSSVALFDLSYQLLKDKFYVDVIAQTPIGESLGLTHDFLLDSVSFDETLIYDQLIDNLSVPEQAFASFISSQVLAANDQLDLSIFETKIAENSTGQVLLDYINGDLNVLFDTQIETITGGDSLLTFTGDVGSTTILDELGSTWVNHGNG